MGEFCHSLFEWITNPILFIHSFIIKVAGKKVDRIVLLLACECE